MKNVIVDYRISNKSIKVLENNGYTAIKMPKLNKVYEAINGHPDIGICIIKDTVFLDNSLSQLEPVFGGYKIVYGNGELNNKYPMDILYNCAVVGDNIICNKKYTEKKIISYCEEQGINIIDTKQGYAKCSVCVVSDNAVITSDSDIQKKAERNGIDTLRVNNDGIRLKGFDYGFFGGTTGLLEKDLLCVNGDISLYKEKSRVTEFCEKYGVHILALNDEPLYDVGTIMRLWV